MRIEFDSSVCQGHNRCYVLAPRLFDVDDEGYAILRLGDGGTAELPEDLIDNARLAADNCPEFAIVVSDR